MFTARKINRFWLSFWIDRHWFNDSFAFKWLGYCLFNDRRNFFRDCIYNSFNREKWSFFIETNQATKEQQLSLCYLEDKVHRKIGASIVKPAITDIALNPVLTTPFLELKTMIFVVWCCCLSSISRRSIPCFHWHSNLKLFNKFIITIRLRQRLDTLLFGEGARRMTPHKSK